MVRSAPLVRAPRVKLIDELLDRALEIAPLIEEIEALTKYDYDCVGSFETSLRRLIAVRSPSFIVHLLLSLLPFLYLIALSSKWANASTTKLVASVRKSTKGTPKFPAPSLGWEHTAATAKTAFTSTPAAVLAPPLQTITNKAHPIFITFNQQLRK